MQHLQVACAIIERGGALLATRRSTTMSLPLKWEFPGGKIAAGELPAECLRRELIEELGLYITVGRALPPHTHNYHTFTVTLHPFVYTIASGEITLHEHTAFSWLPPKDLHMLDWADADLPVIKTYTDSLKAAIT